MYFPSRSDVVTKTSPVHSTGSEQIKRHSERSSNLALRSDKKNYFKLLQHPLEVRYSRVLKFKSSSL